MKSFPRRRRRKIIKANIGRDIGTCEVCCRVNRVSNVTIRKWTYITFKSKLCGNCYLLLAYDDSDDWCGISIPEYIPIEQNIRYLRSKVAKKKKEVLERGKKKKKIQVLKGT